MPERRRKPNSNRRRRRAAPRPEPIPVLLPSPSVPAATPRPDSPTAQLPTSPTSPSPPPPPPPSPPQEDSAQPCRSVCRPLRWGVDRPTAARPGLAEWSELCRSTGWLSRRLASDEPADPYLDPLFRLKHLDPLDGDDPYRWLSIGQGVPNTIEAMNLTIYAPMLEGPRQASPFEDGGSADQPLPFDIFDPDALGSDRLRSYVKVFSPMDLALVMLDRHVFTHIAEATNQFAYGRGADDPMLSDWYDTDWSEMFRFYLANHLILAIRSVKVCISEEVLFQNPLLGRMFSPWRFHQLTLAWRLKTDDQTPDDFLEHATKVLCANFRHLIADIGPVLNLHTYQLPLWCGRHKEIMDAECRITVLKTGRYVLRAVFHKKAIDSQQSGNVPSISVELLKELLDGLQLEGKYITAVGGATVDMAKFLHLKKNAYFVGSVGPQAYRIMNPHKKILTPKLPSAGLYLEPYPDVREVILVREVTRDPSEIAWIGFPTSKKLGLQQMHLICNIGGGKHRSIYVPGPKRTSLEVRVPDSLWTMQTTAVANEVGVRQLLFENISGANKGCMLWHQRVVMHLLNIGFLNGWHAHAIATGNPLYRANAADDIFHHLFGFMYDWVIRRHNLRSEPPLVPDDDAAEEWEIPLPRGKMRFRVTPGSPLEVGVDREPNAPPGDISHLFAALDAVRRDGEALPDNIRIPTRTDPSGAIFAADACGSANCELRLSKTTRTVTWTCMAWRSIAMVEALERPKLGDRHSDWHGSETRDGPGKGSKTATIQEAVVDDLKSYPLFSPEGIALGKRPAAPTLGATEMFYWGGLKMMPCTPNDDSPWRNVLSRRNSV